MTECRKSAWASDHLDVVPPSPVELEHFTCVGNLRVVSVCWFGGSIHALYKCGSTREHLFVPNTPKHKRGDASVRASVSPTPAHWKVQRILDFVRKRRTLRGSLPKSVRKTGGAVEEICKPPLPPDPPPAPFHLQDKNSRGQTPERAQFPKCKFPPEGGGARLPPPPWIRPVQHPQDPINTKRRLSFLKEASTRCVLSRETH